MAAKKSAKKAAAKTAKKKEDQAPPTSFNLLSRAEQFGKATSAALKTLLEKRKGREVNMSTQSELLLDTLPLRSLYLQYCIGNRGLPKGLTELIGKDRLGKTSLIYHLFGGFLQAQIPCAIIPCDNKKLESVWASRCLTSDRSVAHQMASSVHVIPCHILPEMAEMVEAWARTLRNPSFAHFVPFHIPLVLAIDPLNSLATDAQAAGLSSYDGKIKEKPTEIGDKGHSWDRAKWLHDWMPRLLVLQAECNIHLIISEHQNEKDVAGGGGRAPSFIPQHMKELNHRTKNGGQATNQRANLQFTFADKNWCYSAGEKLARRLTVKPFKNSYGAEERNASFALYSGPYNDTDTFLDPSIRFDFTEIEWMAENGYLGMRASGADKLDQRYSCDVLGFTQLSLVEAAKVWREAPQQIKEDLGKQLRIPGYINAYEEVVRQIAPDQEQRA